MLSLLIAGLVHGKDDVEAMARGVGHLERYEYRPALDVFTPLARKHPRWVAAHVNAGLAALNLQKKQLVAQAESSFLAALKIDPRCAHALLSLGILQRHQNRLEEAAVLLGRAQAVDPRDPYVLYYRGATLADLERRDEAKKLLEQTVRLQPSFASAWYRLGSLYAREGKSGRARRREVLKKFQRLERGKAGIKAGFKYGEGGQYNQAMRDSLPPGAKATPSNVAESEPPRFGAPVIIASEIQSFRRLDGKRQPPGFAIADLDGNGALEVAVCGVPGPERGRGDELMTGIRIRGLGGDGVPDRRAFLPSDASICAIGDLDGDGDLDLVGGASEGLTVWLNDGKGAWSVAKMRGLDVERGSPVRLVCIDMDSDWDVDIVALRQVATEEGEIVSRLHVFSNNQDGSFRDVAKEGGVADHDFAAVEMVWADLDGDLDLDLVVIDGATGRPSLYANDRLWAFRRVEAAKDLAAPQLVSARGGDFDGDGDEDLLLLGDAVQLWINEGGLRFRADDAFARRHRDFGGTTCVTFDFHGELRPSVLIVDAARDAPSARWIESIDGPARKVALSGTGRDSGTIRAAAVAAGGKSSALIVADTKNGVRAFPFDVAGTWLSLELRGPGIGVARRQMIRSNTSGIGAIVEVRAGRRRGVWQLNTGSGGTAREPTRLFAGLGGRSSADHVRILWPDGVLQSEIGLAAGRHHVIEEVERKPSSCPIVFAWDGDEMRFVADVLGVGGLGYLESPGHYSTPDPTELLKLPQLATRADTRGELFYDVRMLEPLEECTYLDRASLLVVDHPRDVTIVPFEMFAVSGPTPGFEIVAYRDSIEPVRALDHRGVDVTRELLDIDQQRAPRLDRDPRFPGVARGLHAVEIDFGDDVDRLLANGDDGARPILLLHGHIEYGYSTSNFASFQAGFTPRVPTFSVRRDGRWVPIREEWGFPAGYPRWMAVDLHGALRRGDRRLRVETNLEIQWDRVLLSAGHRVPVSEVSPERPLVGALDVRVHEIDADFADLRLRGFPGDGPMGAGGAFESFAYDDFHRIEPFRVVPGRFTRYGDVAELLRDEDDRQAVFGPGDEICMRFPAGRTGDSAAGRARSFLLRCVGYCKDLDLYTARPDGVEPLPFRAMKAYPPGPGERSQGLSTQKQSRASLCSRRVQGGLRVPVWETFLGELPRDE